VNVGGWVGGQRREEGRAREEDVPDLNLHFSPQQIIALRRSQRVLEDHFEGDGLGRACFLGEINIAKLSTAQGTTDGEIVGAPFFILLGLGEEEGRGGGGGSGGFAGGGRGGKGGGGSGGSGAWFKEIGIGEPHAAAKGARMEITAAAVRVAVGVIVLVHTQHARRRRWLCVGCSCCL